MVRSPLSQHALAALRVVLRFPTSIREALLSDLEFQRTYEITPDADIVFAGHLSLRRSLLFAAIRNLIVDSDENPVVKDTNGRDWHVSRDANGHLVLAREEYQFYLPDFSA